MDDPFDTYRTHEWFQGLAWQHQWIEFMVGWWVGTYGRPKNMIDYGSGDGWWSHTFKAAGAEHCYAVELDAIAAEHTPPDVYFIQHDLREPLRDLAHPFELVMCLEVAEHIPKHLAHNALLETLARSTEQFLIFSAAQPGQPGTGHVNLQPQSYWIEAMEKRAYIKLSPERTGAFRQACERIVPEGLAFLPRNLLVFAHI